MKAKYLKHEQVSDKSQKPTCKPTKKPPQSVKPVPVPDAGPLQPLQHEVNYVSGLAGIEQSLDWIARGLERLTDDGHAIGISTGYGTTPVQITLADNDHTDTMDRLVTAFERIADSLGRLAGLSRPRLESWHEQDEYAPRYKDTACDGGAPGPKMAEGS